MKTMIELKNLEKSYKGTQVPILTNISFHVDCGDVVAIVGESGVGKTTLLKIILGYENYDNGICKVMEKNTTIMSIAEKNKVRSRFMGYIPQENCFMRTWSVYDNVVLPLLLNDFHKQKDIQAVFEKTLRMVHLDYSKYAFRKTETLSGGELQRVAIARALISTPQILIADELTCALDYGMKTKIVELLGQLRDSGVTIVFSTHDKEILKICSHILYLSDGRIMEDSAVM